MHLLLNIINNAYAGKHKWVFCPYKIKYLPILNWLELKGFIYSYKLLKNNQTIKIYLKYYKNKPLGLLILEKKSTNTNYYKVKHYKKKDQLQKNIMCISTTKGLLTKSQSISFNQGGVFLFSIKLYDKNIDG